MILLFLCFISTMMILKVKVVHNFLSGSGFACSLVFFLAAQDFYHTGFLDQCDLYRIVSFYHTCFYFFAAKRVSQGRIDFICPSYSILFYLRHV